MPKSDDINKFLNKGFFRSKDGENYVGISLLWNYKRNVPQLGIFYNNSWLKFTPHQILSDEMIEGFLEYLRGGEWIKVIWSLYLERIDDVVRIELVNNNKKYGFDLSKEEVLLLKGYLIYAINFISQYDLLQEIDDVTKKSDSYIKDYLSAQEQVTVDKYNSEVFKDNIIKDHEWRYQSINIPLIEQEFHGQSNKIKTGYYFKFFSEYSRTLRDREFMDGDYMWSKYPIQVIVQQENNSDIITLSESNVYEILWFIRSVVTSWSCNSTNVRENVEMSIEMTNSYQWKIYTNTDNIKEDDFLLLQEYQSKWESHKILDLLIRLKNSGQLKNNKFVNDKVASTIKLQERVFKNLSIWHAWTEGVDSDSWIFQIGHMEWSKECVLNIVRGDLNKGWKQYGSVKLDERTLMMFIYKLEKSIEILNSPLNQYLCGLYSRLETIRYFNTNTVEEFMNSSLIRRLLDRWSDSKFLKAFSYQGGKSKLDVSLFLPNIIKQLNTSIFNLKSDLPDIWDDRYPISLKLSSEGNKICYFTLNIGSLLDMLSSVKAWRDFELMGKGDTYKKLHIKQKEGKLFFWYFEGISTEKISSGLRFYDSFDKETFCEDFSYIYNLINSNVNNFLVKAIVHSSNKIKFNEAR